MKIGKALSFILIGGTVLFSQIPEPGFGYSDAAKSLIENLRKKMDGGPTTGNSSPVADSDKAPVVVLPANENADSAKASSMEKPSKSEGFGSKEEKSKVGDSSDSPAKAEIETDSSPKDSGKSLSQEDRISSSGNEMGKNRSSDQENVLEREKEKEKKKLKADAPEEEKAMDSAKDSSSKRKERKSRSSDNTEQDSSKTSFDKGSDKEVSKETDKESSGSPSKMKGPRVKEVHSQNQELSPEERKGNPEQNSSDLIKRIMQKLDAVKGTHKPRSENSGSEGKSGPALLSEIHKREKELKILSEPPKIAESSSPAAPSIGASATLQLRGTRSFGELSDEELIQYARENVWSSDRSKSHNPPPTPPYRPKKAKVKAGTAKASSQKSEGKSAVKKDSSEKSNSKDTKTKSGKAKKK
ncbi:MAG: hypothetical protein WA705_21110 [Candidatus Ozemobacteraceae bacterium]